MGARTARAFTNQQRITENRLADKEQLIAQLQSEVVFLREQLTQQIATKEQQLAEKDQQLKELLSANAAWREQVRYKELQLARLQDRVIELPSPEEAEPTEQEPELSQPGESGNVLRRFWHYL
jgi:predicted nuclease with TOPRIM domain